MEVITNYVQVNVWTKAITDCLRVLERMKEIAELSCQDSNQFFSWMQVDSCIILVS